jgi:hypothetical protein
MTSDELQSAEFQLKRARERSTCRAVASREGGSTLNLRSVLWRQRRYNLFEARIAAQRIVPGQQFQSAVTEKTG